MEMRYLQKKVLQKRGTWMIKNDMKSIKVPLIVFIILIILSLTIPYYLPNTLYGSYLLWIVLTIIAIIYGIIVTRRIR